MGRISRVMEEVYKDAQLGKETYGQGNRIHPRFHLVNKGQKSDEVWTKMEKSLQLLFENYFPG